MNTHLTSTSPQGNQTTTPAQNDRGTFLTPQELADMFSVPLETVYQWRRKRTGPPGFRAGRHLRYDLDAVRAWVADQTRKAA